MWPYIIAIVSNSLWFKGLHLAATCDFQQCGILTSVDSEEPVQPPAKLRNSNDVRSVAEDS